MAHPVHPLAPPPPADMTLQQHCRDSHLPRSPSIQGLAKVISSLFFVVVFCCFWIQIHHSIFNLLDEEIVGDVTLRLLVGGGGSEWWRFWDGHCRDRSRGRRGETEMKITIWPHVYQSRRGRRPCQTSKGYFAPNSTNSEEYFQRWFRMHRDLFNTIVRSVEGHDHWFSFRTNPTGEFSASSFMKCTTTLVQNRALQTIFVHGTWAVVRSTSKHVLLLDGTVQVVSKIVCTESPPWSSLHM